MNAPPEEGAWLEAADGTFHPIQGSCSLGRAAANTIVVESPKVSRRHALIHLQNIGELWLIDFGSSNGTFLNRRRIHHPDSIERWAIKSQSEIRFSNSASHSPFQRSTKRT